VPPVVAPDRGDRPGAPPAHHSDRSATSRPSGPRTPSPGSPTRTPPSSSASVGDAIELAELLEFLGNWLESDHGNLAGSLARFIGGTAYGPGSLREDFARFRFLLGATDGEGLFTPDEP
jgi:hypothetical protein